MINLFKKYIRKLFFPYTKSIYSQAGEDIIMYNLFGRLNIQKPFYLDIGANHPKFISNTYFFYRNGSNGVCVEPNPYLFKKLQKHRKRDICINSGIGPTNQVSADFYLFPNHAHGLSTFSKEEALHWGEVGMKGVGKIKYEKIIQMELKNINNIIKDYCKQTPDLISIDVEGLDLDILQSLDYERYKPKVICVETLGYDEYQKEFKRTEIIDFLITKGYTVYADTYINTIMYTIN